MKKSEIALVPQETIESKIFFLRGKRVMLDRDLAILYGVETKYLKRQVNRNIERFPEDFMFQLAKDEFNNLRSQIGTSSWGVTRYLSYAFTEQGVAMLSSVLNSDRAIQVNIQIIGKFFGLVCLQYLQKYLPPVAPRKFKERTESKKHVLTAEKTPTNLTRTSQKRV